MNICWLSVAHVDLQSIVQTSISMETVHLNEFVRN